MKQKNESVEKLEVGKDYIDTSGYGILIIDRKGDSNNDYFYDDEFKSMGLCQVPYGWREATEAEVIEAFRKHLVHRYGEDWKTMKIKERHPDLYLEINDGSWEVEIVKLSHNGWVVYNQNGMLYCNGIWVERLEEKEEESKIHIKEAIKTNTAIHCETEEEANRVLGMAHTLGYKWWTGMNYKNNTEWNIYKSKMCYDLFGGAYSHYDYFKNKNYTIISSIQIADLRTKSTDSSPAPEDIEAMNKKEKASETQIGGSHYLGMAIQPIEFIHKNGLSFIQGNIIKYVCRYKLKGGIEDLQKAKHCIDLLIELEEE